MPPHILSSERRLLMSKKRSYQKFNKEFIESAVRLVETGKSAAQVALEAGNSP